MKNSLSKVILVCIILFNVSYCFSQSAGTKTADSTEVSNSLRSGKWALTFGIGTDFSLTNFDDALIALKYQFSSKSALRLDFNFDYVNLQNSEEDYSENQSRQYGTNLSFLYYLNPKESFNVYLGLGANFSYSYNYNKYSVGYSEITTWTAGPKITAGAEYFVFKSFSLFAEYNYIFGFGKREYNDVSSVFTDYSNSSDITSFQKNNVKFGLSVYF
jgi:hypothetical protein